MKKGRNIYSCGNTKIAIKFLGWQKLCQNANLNYTRKTNTTNIYQHNIPKVAGTQTLIGEYIRMVCVYASGKSVCLLRKEYVMLCYPPRIYYRLFIKPVTLYTRLYI